MSAHIRVITCPDFIRYDAHGKLDAAASRACLAAIATECHHAGVRDALLDTRDITDAPTFSELFWLADDLPVLGFSPQIRLAIVYVDRHTGRATFFANAAHNHGFNFREFTDFEAAFAWLSTATPVDD